MKKILKISILFLIVVIIILFAAFDNRLKIVNYKIETDSISDSVKIALITDLHCCLYGDNQSALIDAIDKYRPDAVLLAGDIFDDYYVNDNSHILINNIVRALLHGRGHRGPLRHQVSRRPRHHPGRRDRGIRQI